MHAKITVNGVSYDSVEAMPLDVRRLYEETLARLPSLMGQGDEGTTRIIQRGGLSIGHAATVHSTFMVNGKSYQGLESMPPDVRQAYEQAMRAAEAGAPGVSRNEIKMSFQITGPGGIRKTFGAPGLLPESSMTELEDSRAPMKSVAIEPSSTERGIRTAILIGGCVILGLVLLAWLR